MVGAGIHHDGRTALVSVNGAPTGQIHRHEILQHHVTSRIFQHDTARDRRDFLQQNNVHVLP